MLQNFGGGGATFRCFITAYAPELDAHGPGTRPGGRPGPWGACYVLGRYMPFSVDEKGLTYMRLRLVGPCLNGLRSTASARRGFEDVVCVEKILDWF